MARDRNQAGAVDEPRDGDPERLFRTGLALLDKRRRVTDALLLFEKAHTIDPEEPRYASYYGLSLALCGQRVADAEQLCTRAAKERYFDAELLCNLGRVHLMRGNRRRAYFTFQEGLSADRSHSGIRHELEAMGTRGPPVVSFLDRDHRFNRLLGRIRGYFSH